MTRRTAAERKQEAARMFQLSEEARVNRESAEYPARLMKAFERINNQYDINLSVQSGLFLVTNSREPRYTTEYRFGYEYSEAAQKLLEEFEHTLDALEEAQAEARRRVEVKKEAQRKAQEVFTAEERELLGL